MCVWRPRLAGWLAVKTDRTLADELPHKGNSTWVIVANGILLLLKPRQDDSHTVFSSSENTGHVTGLGGLLVARCPVSDKGAARRGRGCGVAGGGGGGGGAA